MTVVFVGDGTATALTAEGAEDAEVFAERLSIIDSLCGGFLRDLCVLCGKSAVLSFAVMLVMAATTACAAQPVPQGRSSLSARIATLNEHERAQWSAYLDRSARLQKIDRDTIAAELRALGRDRMIPAPNARTSFGVQSHMRGEWFRTDSARRMAESILSYQSPSGGWSKHVDFIAGPRQPGTSYFSENDGWNFIATLDNNSTTDELRFLGRAWQVTGDGRYRTAIERGITYLLEAQYPNGCWPQVYPLMGGYHDAATFNDDASVNALRVLRDVARGHRSYPDVGAATRRRADSAVRKGVECIIASQVVVNGIRTIWGQQHDALTLEPVKARSYEHPSLASRESAGIVAFLMELPEPDAAVTGVVRAAVEWFKSNAIHGLAYDMKEGVVERPGAGPAWARMSEIGTNRPIYSNRDGVILYDYTKLTDRRTGYLWISTEPATVLEKYEKWNRTSDGGQRTAAQ